MIEQRATPESFSLLYRRYIPGDERMRERMTVNGVSVAIIATEPGNGQSDHIYDLSGVMYDGSTGVLFPDLHLGAARWSSDRRKNGQVYPAPAVDLLYDTAAQADWYVPIGDYGEFLNTPARILFASKTWRHTKERSQEEGMSPGILIDGNHDWPPAVEKWQQKGRFVTTPTVTHVFPSGGVVVGRQTVERELTYARAAEIDKEMGQAFDFRGEALLRYSAADNRLTWIYHGDQLALNADDPSLVSRIVHHMPEVFFKPLAWSMQETVEFYGERAYAEFFQGGKLRDEALQRFLRELPQRNQQDQSLFEKQIERFRPALPNEFCFRDEIARHGVVYPGQKHPEPLVVQLGYGHFHEYMEIELYDDVTLPKGVVVCAYNGGYHVPGIVRVGLDDGKKIVCRKITYED